MIDEIIKEFDYVKVHDCMVALNWKWAATVNFTHAEVGVYKTPDIETLQLSTIKNLYGLVEKVENDERPTFDWYFSSGGFKYELHKENNVITDITLSFVITDWSTNNTDYQNE